MPPRDPDSRFPAESGNGPFPDSESRFRVPNSFGRHRPKSPSHSPPSPHPSRHPPSAGPWQFKQLRSVGGGRNFESVFQGLKATSSPGSCMLYSHRRVSPISRFAANRDPDSRSRPNRESGIPGFPIPAKSGIGDSLPDARPNRESGERELGISGSCPTGTSYPLRVPEGYQGFRESRIRDGGSIGVPP